jgi:hypothetical protein
LYSSFLPSLSSWPVPCLTQAISITGCLNPQISSGVTAGP